jgi:hypothetical protein
MLFRNEPESRTKSYAALPAIMQEARHMLNATGRA